MIERELGSEAGSTACPSCGATLALAPGAVDGILESANCESCWPSTPTETAAVVEVRETGSDSNQADLFDDEESDDE